ncbi:hypothetical protein EJ08DRAFT_604586 [Tothia fuscella]|uniref:Heterokaryon incompatibility domain-containing protein n=1 Tax=Tothia fuscella TaxID=1048955 RepID=A0A9P4U406_9PEZI|nr:hypothetical protein EJ08DRAFT_604586 [Tothia fuscella]
MPVTVLCEPSPAHGDKAPLLDIIAVHGLYEGAVQTWTDRQTNVLWLRDLFPYCAYGARILLYHYNADVLASPGEANADEILPYATAMVTEISAHRSAEGAYLRPIIFVSHGFGGLLVKRALVFSRERQIQVEEPLRMVYMSTFALIFMGTPHEGMRKQSILFLVLGQAAPPSQFVINLLEGSEMIKEVTTMFSPIRGEFRISNFWEEYKTFIGTNEEYIVTQNSAAPGWEDVHKHGIKANHSDMVKMRTVDDHKYQDLKRTLEKYSRDAADYGGKRWLGRDTVLNKSSVEDLNDRYQTPLDDVPINDTFTTDINKWFLVDRSPTIYFTGRETHARIMKNKFTNTQRQKGRKSHPIYVIYGLGGSGKTQFCLKYVHDNRQRYWGVFWIDASTVENAEASFGNIDQHVRKGVNHSREASYSAAMHWLLQCRKPWLLILDNADDPDMDISRYIPAGTHGQILITTRNPNIIEHATAGHLRFRGMDPEEGINLLLKAAAPVGRTDNPSPQSRTLAKGIASELGYLALPLALAGATIRRRIHTLERYLQHYLSHRKDMLSRPPIQGAEDVNIIATWEIPFQRIQKIADRPSIEHRDAVDLLHMFAFMHFESIHEEIFQRAWSAIEESQVDFTSFPSILQPGRRENFTVRMRSAIGVLSDYSIVDYEYATRVCMLHPVVHAWAQERLDLSTQQKWLDCTFSVIGMSISERMEASGRGFRQRLIPHLDSCLRILRHQCPSFPATLSQAVDTEKFARVYAENGQWSIARELYIKVIGLRTKLLGRWHEATLRAHKFLGDTYWNLFELEPLIKQQRWMLVVLWFVRPSIWHWFGMTLLFPNHIAYCLALDDLTQSLWLVGMRDWSRYTGERAVKGLVKHLGEEDPKTLTAMFNLGRTYIHLGKHEAARAMILNVLKKRKRFFGMDHFDTLMVRNELGVLLYECGRNLHLAERLVSNVLRSRKKLLGEEHAYTLWSVNDVSKIVCERGRPTEAVKMLQDIIPTVTRTLGENHPGMTMTKANLTKAYARCGDWASAEEILRPLLNSIPPNHPDWIRSKYGYICIQFRLEKYDQVEKDCTDILAHFQKSRLLPMSDPRAIAFAEKLLSVFRIRNGLAEIEQLKKQVPLLNEDRLVGKQFDVYATSAASTASSVKTHRSSTRYEYMPLLSESSFRVLELSPGRLDEELKYTLSIEDWTQSPAYEAMSYAWGDAKVKLSTSCDDQSLEITRNLYEALLRLRYEDKPRRLWADAICINQTNLEERGQQVGVMRQIYRNAQNVIVWLGQDEENQASEAASFICTLTETLTRTPSGHMRNIKDMDNLWEMTSHTVPIEEDAPWLAVGWYFSRPWFQRLWVFQEVNSNTNVDVICGHTCLSWDAVGLAATYMKRWPILRDKIAQMEGCFWYNAYIMRSRHHQATMSAASMLSQGQNFVTTDSRDRIFALLGTRPLRAWEKTLKPDYWRHTRESLYLEVARRCLLEERDTSFLSYVQHSRTMTMEGLPTWVPEWDQDLVRVPIATPNGNWAACGDSTVKVEFVGEGDVLMLHGIVFDKACQKWDIDRDEMFCSNEQFSNDQEEDTVCPLLELWHKQTHQKHTLYPSVRSKLEAFAASFVFGYRATYGNDYRARMMADFTAYAAHVNAPSSQHASGAANIFSELHSERPDSDWRNYIEIAHKLSHGRSLFITSKGYLGIAPNTMEDGDVVCILHGFKVPYILRSVNGPGHYVLIGDAYIHGIMDGEVMAQISSGDLKEEVCWIH